MSIRQLYKTKSGAVVGEEDVSWLCTDAPIPCIDSHMPLSPAVPNVLRDTQNLDSPSENQPLPQHSLHGVDHSLNITTNPLQNLVVRNRLTNPKCTFRSSAP